MNENDFLSEFVSSASTEREIEYATAMLLQAKDNEEKQKVMDDLRSRFMSKANKANPPTVKATASAAKAAEEAGISLSDVPSTDGKITVEDVKKAVESNDSK